MLQEVQEAWWLLLKIQRNYLPLPLWSAASAEQRLLPYPSVAWPTNKSGQCEDVLLTINFPPVITRIYVLFILLNYPPLLHMQIHSHRIDLILLLLIKPSSSSSLAVQFLYCRSSRCAAIQCWSLFVVNRIQWDNCRALCAVAKPRRRHGLTTAQQTVAIFIVITMVDALSCPQINGQWNWMDDTKIYIQWASAVAGRTDGSASAGIGHRALIHCNVQCLLPCRSFERALQRNKVGH